MMPTPRSTSYDELIAQAKPVPYWLDASDAPAVRPPLDADSTVDLLIVGGGLTGLWAALQAAEGGTADSIMLLEGATIAQGASGRNGGFCEASLTHGLANGISRWPDEIGEIERLSRENLVGIEDTVRRFQIDCQFERTGTISVATRQHQLPELEEEADLLRSLGWDAELLDSEQLAREVRSPTYLAGLLQRDTCAMIHPARLCWGLARAAESLGVSIHEETPVLQLHDEGATVCARTRRQQVRARRVFLATSAFPPLVRTIRRYVVPVYDYVLVTNPLTSVQREAVGWQGRQGISDSGNQFHYYRLTPDDRILWGGYDAVYYYGNDMGRHREQRPETFALLAEHFFATFPQLEGIGFSHRWGGAIDTCSRFCVLFGRQMNGKLAYAVGFTGLGVGASRFGAATALDLLWGRDSERTRLRMVRSKPIPFPPEPLRFAGISLTRRTLAQADRNDGRRGLWLRTLDRLGMGFDS